MTTVLVTRARADAERTAARLREMGFTPLLSPVLEVEATGAVIPKGPFDAVLATSAKALECAAGADLAALSRLPLYVVGARTAQAATRHRLRVNVAAPDVAALISALRESYGPLPVPPPRSAGEGTLAIDGSRSPSPAKRGRVGEGASPKRFLYLAGRDRKDDLERALAEAGHDVTIVEVYAAHAAQVLSDEAATALAKGEVDAVLHYSKRSVEILLELARAAGLMEKLRNVAHLALSRDVAAPLEREIGARALIAEKPDEDYLLRLLGIESA